jgi:methionine sulfoxide reductase heme-binding subunit
METVWQLYPSVTDGRPWIVGSAKRMSCVQCNGTVHNVAVDEIPRWGEDRRVITETASPITIDSPRRSRRRPRPPLRPSDVVSLLVAWTPPAVWLSALLGLLVDMIEREQALDRMLAAVEAPGVVMLGLTLLCSPFGLITGRNFRRRRRWFGLSFAFCGLGNLAVFVIRHPFADLLQPFVLVALAALTLTLPLAVTSTKRAIRWLGGRRWRRLHRLVYVVAALVILHLWIVPQNDGPEGNIVSTAVYGAAAVLRIPAVTRAVTNARSRRGGGSLLSARTWLRRPTLAADGIS